VLEKSTVQVEQFLSGNDKIKGFFVGQVMKRTNGTANPKLVQEILDEELEKRKG
jgi:aspartyl-tRNA(Asn)/glutamyl-tRNA(Gln) amidotransferase subunit B